MSVANPEKGARYLAQLDQALCNGSWSEIPELARKTDKHAPERKCFTLAARSEAQIASASHRPTSAASTTSTSIYSLGELIPKLTEAIGGATSKFPEDAYAARVCLAEVCWLRDDASAALESISDTEGLHRGQSTHTAALGWLEVCDAKLTFLEAASLESLGKEDEARQRYLKAANRAPGSRTPELRRWTERLLAGGCMFMKRRASPPSLQNLEDALRCFQAWSHFWQRSPPSTTSAAASHLDMSRREVWRAYYELLSTILQYGLIYNAASSTIRLMLPSEDLADEQLTSAKVRQRAAMRRVESTYESLLLNETQFPKASQTNTEVEQWVEQVARNWTIFSGPNWTDAEVGDGGKESLGRGVLDILYRAATKTFHSTAILRQLFTVHAALGEFELAMHAFDSYVEIFSKGKARAEKTGKRDAALDSDDSAVLTASEAVRVLCRYGDREQAEKAEEIAKTIRGWLKLQDGQQDAAVSLQSKTMAAAHRALGIERAHWATLTYENDARRVLRAEALASLREARRCDSDSLETAHALALLHAESRDVAAAQDVIRRAVASSRKRSEEEQFADTPDDLRTEQDLMTLWHLLALCFTAKDEHDQAVKVCEAAFDQFGDPEVLFGERGTRLSVESDQPLSRSARGLVDQMEAFQKSRFLQVKMTQITLLELMEGAEHAVDSTHDLLSLYARLFGRPEFAKPPARPPQTATSAAPSKVGGTLRSIAGSIRPRSARTSLERAGKRGGSLVSLSENRQSRREAQHEAGNDAAMGVPIAITVTNEDGVATEKPHDHRIPFKLRGHHGDWRDHGNLKGTKSAESLREKALPTVDEKAPAVSPKDAEKTDHTSSSPDGPPVLPELTQDKPPHDPSNPEQPLGAIAHNVPHDKQPPPPGHNEQPPRQDVRLPAPHPAATGSPQVRLPSAEDQRYKISILVEVWLFIAGLYLRADMLDDAAGAIGEAYKHVQSFEVEMAAEEANAQRLFAKGWGGGKSVDALWADVWAAKADLASAGDQPFRALEAYEQAVAYYPDHADGIIGLSNLLMDMYEEKMPIEEARPILSDAGYAPVPPRPSLIPLPPEKSSTEDAAPPKAKSKDPSPTELNRLAARDRAYMLLSTLTKLGTGWDNSEAWYTLARAYELSKQIGKAKQALWWVVELEDNKPIRPWRVVGDGGFTL